MSNGFTPQSGGLAGAGWEGSAIDWAVIASIKHAANFLMTAVQAAARSGSGPECVSEALQPPFIHHSALPFKRAEKAKYLRCPLVEEASTTHSMSPLSPAANELSPGDQRSPSDL